MRRSITNHSLIKPFERKPCVGNVSGSMPYPICSVFCLSFSSILLFNVAVTLSCSSGIDTGASSISQTHMVLHGAVRSIMTSKVEECGTNCMSIDSELYEPVCVEIQISEVMEEAIEATLETVDVLNMCTLFLYTLSKKSYATADFPY